MCLQKTQSLLQQVLVENKGHNGRAINTERQELQRKETKAKNLSQLMPTSTIPEQREDKRLKGNSE